MEIMEPGGKIAAYFPITKTPFFTTDGIFGA